MARGTSRVQVRRVTAGVGVTRVDTLAGEEPLELRLGGTPLAVTMRTPGDDFDLAAGFLVGEGVVTRPDQLRTIRYCAGATADGTNTYTVLDVALAPGVPVPELSLRRNFYTSSSCGVCGKASLDAVRVRATFELAADRTSVSPAALAGMPDTLRTAQRVFERTGGLHAAGLFTPGGELLVAREDVGRHNAVDKVVGWALREGRASFELVQKAVLAGIPIMAAVSAPSSLAVELAAEAGLTLVGFLRGDSMNLYTAPDRLSE
jgi:FdhD protein